MSPWWCVLGHGKTQNALKMGRFKTNNGSKVGQKRNFAKSDHGPFGMLKQVVLAHLEPVGARFGPWKIPKFFESGPFWDQKWVKTHSSKSDPRPFGMLKQVFRTHFESVLMEFSLFHHMYAPRCAFRTYARAVLWSHIELGIGV